MKIVYRPIDELKLLPKNFKRHATQEAEGSVMARGFIDPIGVNPVTGHTFDGNGRIEVLIRMRDRWRTDKSIPVPSMITVVKDNWHAPTVEIPMDEDEEVSAAAALNHIGRIGGYDEAFQLEILQEMKEKGTFDATGFTDSDLQSLLKRFPAQKAPETNPDAELGELTQNAPSGLGTMANGTPATTGPGMKVTAPTSSIKQVSLLYAPDKAQEFAQLAIALAPKLNTDNQSDTVLAALRYANEKLSS